jgi:universal stress protein E
VSNRVFVSRPAGARARAVAPTLALELALSLARSHDAELHAVHVRPEAKGEDRQKADEGPLKALVELIERTGVDGIRVAPKVLAGDPVPATAEYARTQSADLIVVAIDGHYGSGFRSPGAFASELGRSVETPIIAAPRTTKIAPGDRGSELSFKNIVCGVDFSPASLRAVEHALRLAQQNAARLTLLHVLEGFPYETVYSGSRALRLIDEYRAAVEKVNSELHMLVPPEALNWCEVDAETVSGAAERVIPMIASARAADLIVIALPRRARLAQWLMGSTAKGVLRQATCPVLIVPASPEESVRMPEAWFTGMDAQAQAERHRRLHALRRGGGTG